LARDRQVPGRGRGRAVTVDGGADPQPAGHADHVAQDVQIGPEPLRQLPGAGRVEAALSLAAHDAQEGVWVDAVQRPRVVEVGGEQVHQTLAEICRTPVAVHYEREDGDVSPGANARR